MDFLSFEDIISKIDGVISVKIISQDENIEEVHVLSNRTRSAKQIVRDIESSLMASFEYKIDRKVISIAQIDTDDYKTIKRIKFDGISMSTSGNYVECNVKLLYEDDEYCVTQKGIKTASNRKKIVAEGTIKTVEKILGQAVCFDIQDVIVNVNGGIKYVNVIVNMIAGDRERNLIGASIVNEDLNEAIAKAALDAINRRIEKIKI